MRRLAKVSGGRFIDASAEDGWQQLLAALHQPRRIMSSEKILQLRRFAQRPVLNSACLLPKLPGIGPFSRPKSIKSAESAD